MKQASDQTTTTTHVSKLRKHLASIAIIPVVSLALVLVVTGCASIVSGTTQKIKIASKPSDAKIVITQLNSVTETNVWEGKTPAAVKLSRKSSYLVKITREGYQATEVPVEYKSMNGWIWGNIIFGGFPGIIVDSLTGAAANIGPDEISVELVGVKTSALGNPVQYAVLRSRNEQGTLMTHALALKAVETK
jgi:hypothetical protein